MSLILIAAWVATFAIGGVLQALNYFLSSGETTAAMAIGGVALAILGGITFYGLVKKKHWALASFVILGAVSIAQFYIIVLMPMDPPGKGEWFRLIAASIMYSLVALFVRYKLNSLQKNDELEG